MKPLGWKQKAWHFQRTEVYTHTYTDFGLVNYFIKHILEALLEALLTQKYLYEC